MKPLKITMILPFPVTKPVGGAKMIYEYANRLQQKGHSITILHAIKRPYKKMKSPLWYKQLLFAVRNVKRPKWFPLHPQVQSLIVPEISDKYVADADIIFSTWWQMAYAVHSLSKEKGIKFNFIQGYEIWAGQSDRVHQSYQLPLHHIVIAQYLEETLLLNGAAKPYYVPNAIDNKLFKILQPIEERYNQSILMLYSQEKIKGSVYGLLVLSQLKKRYPHLKATLFGVSARMGAFPEWIDYVQSPENLPLLYNQHAIFFSPSLGEGWALPPAEAMSCGCAVVCTHIGGHPYALEKETALLVPPKDTYAMENALSQLLSNASLRKELAAQGHHHITTAYSFDNSIAKLENIFYSQLNGA